MSVRRFAGEDWFERDSKGAIDGELLHALYVAWCTVEKTEPISREEFSRALPQLGFTDRDGLVCGIRLSEIGERMRTCWEELWTCDLLGLDPEDKTPIVLTADGEPLRYNQLLLDALLEEGEED